jgi:hypothetical protein
MDAEFLMEDETHYIVMGADDISKEIEVILHAADEMTPNTQKTQQQFAPKIEECWSSVSALVSCLPCSTSPTTQALIEALVSLPNSSIYPLKYACRHAITNIRYIRTAMSGRDFSPTNCFLVSPLWSRRIDRTLSGQLFPAYIGCWHFLSSEK